MSSYRQWRNYTKYVAPTAEEREIAKRMDAEMEQEHAEARDEAISWTAKSGQLIEVYVYGNQIAVSIDGHAANPAEFSQVPAKQAEAARAAGIVAKLGNVGVTAEQKAAIEAKMGR